MAAAIRNHRYQSRSLADMAVGIRTRMLHAVLRTLGYEDGDMRTNGEQRFLRNLPIHSGVVFDVGANIGGWAEVLLEAHPAAQLHCFEPSSSAVAQLENALQGRAELHQLALSDTDGTRPLLSEEAGSPLASFYARTPEMTVVESVATRRLDAFCIEHGITRVALLKIDAEGHELAVLRGATGMLDQIDAIQFEYGGTAVDARVYLRDFFELLSDNFELYRLWRFGRIHAPKWTELLEFAVYQNWVALRKR